MKRGRTGDATTQTISLMWETRASHTRGHGDVRACGSSTAWVCINVCGLRYHSEAVLTPEGYAELVSLLARAGPGGMGEGEWCTDQLSCPPDPDSRLWISPPQHLPHLGASGAHDWSWRTQLWDLLDSGQQQDIREQFRWGPSTDGVPEARALNQTNTHYKEPSQLKLLGQESTLCAILHLPVPLWPTNTRDGGVGKMEEQSGSCLAELETQQLW